MNFKWKCGGYLVSTVRLRVGGRLDERYETCIFEPNGDSDAVQRYPNLFLAWLGHRYWKNEVLKRMGF